MQVAVQKSFSFFRGHTMISNKLSPEYPMPNDALVRERTNSEINSTEESLTSEKIAKLMKYRPKEVKIFTMGQVNTFVFTTWATVSDGNSIKVCESETEISENEMENSEDEELVKTCQQSLIHNTQKEDDDNNRLIEEKIGEILNENAFSIKSIEEEPEVLDENIFRIDRFKEEPELVLDENTFPSELSCQSINTNYQRTDIYIENEEPADSTQKIKYHFLPDFEPKPIEWFKEEFEEDSNCLATYGKSVAEKYYQGNCVSKNALLGCEIRGCGKNLKKKNNLKRRNILCHNDDMLYKCPRDKCGQKFIKLSELKKHVCTPIKVLKYGSKLHVCPVCGKNFSNEKRLKLHFSIHRRAKKITFQCGMNGCEKTFSWKASLLRHIKSHNADRIDFVTECPLGKCGKKFTRQDALKSHIFSHINANYCSVEGLSYLNEREIPTYICATCEKIFVAKIFLQRHVMSHMGIKEFKYVDRSRSIRIFRHECPLGRCGRKFAHPTDLHNHICGHIGKNNCSAEGLSYLDTRKITTYDCSSCEKIFASKAYLKRHMGKHSSNKSFECKIYGCGRKFAYQSSLSRHARTHRGDKTFVCGLGNCRSAFNRSDVLQAHICALHISQGKLTPEARSYFQDRNIKIYDCAYCEKVYMQENRYQIHLSQHKNETH